MTGLFYLALSFQGSSLVYAIIHLNNTTYYKHLFIHLVVREHVGMAPMFYLFCFLGIFGPQEW